MLLIVSRKSSFRLKTTVMTEIKGKLLDTCKGQFIRLKFKCYFRIAIIR
jgi:hypothetical protein